MSLLKHAVMYARRNRWLHPLGRAAFHAPLIGPVLRREQRRVLPPGERVWAHVGGGLGQGLWLQADPYREQEYLRGNGEPVVQRALAAYLKPGDCFFDVGAHVGFYSLIASRLVGTRGRVVAFEPDPRNAQLLREHAARNGLSNIAVKQAAVWRCHSEVQFMRGGGSVTGKSSRWGAVIEAGAAARSGEVISVEAVSLDYFSGGSDSPALIKIDVEGAETEVLKGAERLLAQVKPTLICEVHHLQAATFVAEFLPARHYNLQWAPVRSGFPFPRHLLAFPMPLAH